MIVLCILLSLLLSLLFLGISLCARWLFLRVIRLPLCSGQGSWLGTLCMTSHTIVSIILILQKIKEPIFIDCKGIIISITLEVRNLGSEYQASSGILSSGRKWVKKPAIDHVINLVSEKSFSSNSSELNMKINWGWQLFLSWFCSPFRCPTARYSLKISLDSRKGASKLQILLHILNCNLRLWLNEARRFGENGTYQLSSEHKLFFYWLGLVFSAELRLLGISLENPLRPYLQSNIYTD